MNNRAVTHKDARPRPRGVRGKSGGAWGSNDERKRFFFEKAVQNESRRQVEASSMLPHELSQCIESSRKVPLTVRMIQELSC